MNGLGGADGDKFVFRSTADLGKGVNAGTITDFTGANGAGDVIDLTAIDANTTKHGNQDFKFTTCHFHHKAGELHLKAAGVGFLLEGDANGDVKADFQIKLDGTVTITQQDILGLVT